MPSRVYDEPETLWQACREYFQWAHEHPLYEAKTLASGDVVSVAKMRAFTQRSLCLHLKVSDETWRDWRKNRTDLQDVIATVDSIIFTQKFEGAAAGLLNANLISRELGLADRQEVTGRDGEPIEAKNVPEIEVARRIAFVLSQAVHMQSNQTAPTKNEDQK